MRPFRSDGDPTSAARSLATTRASILQKEVTEPKDAGYKIVGMVSRGEHMVVMEREIDAVKP